MFSNDEKIIYARATSKGWELNCDEGEPGAVPKTTSDGLKYVKYFKKVRGRITGIRTKEVEWTDDGGKSRTSRFLCIDLVHKGDKASLSMNLTSIAALSFMKVVERIDPSKEVSMSIADSGTYYSVIVKQDGEYLKHAYTKDNPNGLPEAKPVELPDGGLGYDRREQIAFLMGKVSEWLKKHKDVLALNDISEAKSTLDDEDFDIDDAEVPTDDEILTPKTITAETAPTSDEEFEDLPF